MSNLDFTQNPPRSIDKNHPVLQRNKGMQKIFFLGAAACVPLAFVFPMRFLFGSVSLENRLLIGVGVALLMMALALAMRFNSKKAYNIMRDGVHTMGALHSIDTSSTYITMNLSYKDNLGKTYSGNALIMGKNELVKKQAGDTIDILYLPNRPSRYAVYLEDIGISVFESKVPNA